ncbi:phenylalanine--tRNA ligase beta subunit [Clostridia bacterium]|nr:phenylalanine--tRNA ligase beta subunit [Clostridia bacterium]
MNTSFSWIKSYVPDLEVSPQEYADQMTLFGTKVENFQALNADLDKIVIGQIIKIERHPDADKLVVCQINIGEDSPIQIVTGATNVKEGHKIPVVLDGGRVAGGHDGKKTPGGIKIKKGKLRGIESNGMLCSIEELGSDNQMYPEAPEDGIYIFDDEAVVGESAISVLGLKDVVFEYEVTSNRVDCFSVIGIAREAAAAFGKTFTPPLIPVVGNAEKTEDFIKVSIEDSELCPRYCARVVKNVKLAPSPKWLQRRLTASGIRPINNIVDITNYVMEEYGQPMHAYDLDTLANAEIIVRRGKAGEQFVTLDGQTRNVDESVLMICDGEKAVGLAGIMGGENSMITDQAQTLLFEAANFDGTNIRLSSKKVGLRTDASGKFEKGLDPNLALAAINRACQLIEELGAGEVVGGVVDVRDETIAIGKKYRHFLPLDVAAINRLLGTQIDKATMLDFLERLGFSYDENTDGILIPTWRQDIDTMADLAEEVARSFGYDKIPSTLPQSGTTGKLSFSGQGEAIAREAAEAYGFSEAKCYSFESPKVFDKLLLPLEIAEGSEGEVSNNPSEQHTEKDESTNLSVPKTAGNRPPQRVNGAMRGGATLRNAVRISNPLGEDFSVMRTQTLDGMLRSLALNQNRRNTDVRLYEVGNIYLPTETSNRENLSKQAKTFYDKMEAEGFFLPQERMQFTLGMYGEGDFFALKAVVEDILSKLGVNDKLIYENPTNGRIDLEERSYLHPGRQAEILYRKNAWLGYLGEIHPLVAEQYELKERTYVAVLDLPAVFTFASPARKYEGLAKYPAVTRDISMVVPKGILASDIERIFDKKGGAYLENYELFDLYEGDQIKEGYKSMAYSLVFRAKDKTLEEADYVPAMEKLLAALENERIELRK